MISRINNQKILYFRAMNFYKGIIRKFLFLFDPEKVHHFTFSFLKTVFKIPFVEGIIKNIYSISDKKLHRNILGINFPNPIGLAAGFDKNGILLDELAAFGFGFIEIGTVTPKAQSGNEKPRLFRLPKDQAIINRMGFNNDGVEAMVELLKKKNRNIVIGGNIGKNKHTDNENAKTDYLQCFESLFLYVNYFAINVSSPNTPGLRELQEKEPLLALLNQLQNLNSILAEKHSTSRKPIVLKISPDLSEEQLLEIIDVIIESKLDGVIATNTTTSREGLKTDPDTIQSIGPGGLSGKVLTNRSNEVIRFIANHSNKKFVIIGVGGIHSVEDALEKLDAGAHLIQLYTGFIYEGPKLIKDIKKKLLTLS